MGSTGPAEIPEIIVNFMGLTGPLGALPYAYSELINERLRSKDSDAGRFFRYFQSPRDFPVLPGVGEISIRGVVRTRRAGPRFATA